MNTKEIMTPRTDAETRKRRLRVHLVAADFARTLERELNDYKAMCERLALLLHKTNPDAKFPPQDDYDKQICAALFEYKQLSLDSASMSE